MALVTALENQYDSFVRSLPGAVTGPDTADGVPTADEIGAAAEAFLADLAGRDDEE